MLTAHPNLKGLFVAWDTPAQQAVAAARALGATSSSRRTIAADSAVNVARGSSSRSSATALDQGVAEAKVAALALLGKSACPMLLGAHAAGEEAEP